MTGCKKIVDLVTVVFCVTQHVAVAQKKAVNGGCGAANGTAVSTPPSGNLCAAGAPHYYTVCCDNNTSTITKSIDGGLIYTVTDWHWSGSNPNTIINLAVGGAWPGDLANPGEYSGNLDVYSIRKLWAITRLRCCD